MDCELPTWFNRFLVENGIQKESYCIAADLPRYIRLKDSMALDEVTRDLGSYSLSRVHWLPDFYSIDHDSKIVNCGSFKRGLFYGIDVSSGVAVTALEITKDDQILDLCCAPGAKLCYMADLLGNDGNGTITGVDVSKNRLSIVRSQLKKCKFDRIRLFNADGTKFRACPPKKIGCAMIPRASSDLTDDPIDSSPFHASRLLRGEKCYFNSDYLYDKVIVDAECTHDGSIVHVKNCSWKGWSGLEERLTSKEKLCELEQLQRGLISNGKTCIESHLFILTTSFQKDSQC